MPDLTIDCLRRDECQPAITAQMNNIKSQFHPSNTANVNIVPYEIYDEDGVEQVVGEVRKTIDGVKKKKPVYEITVTKDSVNQRALIVDLSDYDVEKMIGYYGTISNSGYDYIFPYCDSDGYDCHAYTLQSTNVMRCVVVKFPGTTSLTVFIRYTKSTDEWTPV